MCCLRMGIYSENCLAGEVIVVKKSGETYTKEDSYTTSDLNQTSTEESPDTEHDSGHMDQKAITLPLSDSTVSPWC